MAIFKETNGDDVVNGSAGDDLIVGYDGDDTLNGGAGKDRIYGGAANDTITGGDGDDTIWDDEYAAGGDDIVDAGAGDDDITIFGGNDVITGGDGDDTFNLRNTPNGTITITDFTAGSGATDQIDLWGHEWEELGVTFPKNFTELLDVTTQVGADAHIVLNDQLTLILENVDKNDLVEDDFLRFHPDRIGTEGDDVLHDHGNLGETFYGYGGNDTITSWSASDTIYGGDGNDTINSMSGDDNVDGGAGDDIIDAGRGSDVIEGGAGDDVMTGGESGTYNGGGVYVDSYVFGANHGHDTVTDFTLNADIADLSAIFSGSFDQLMMLAEDTPGGVRIATGADAIALVESQGGQLSSAQLSQTRQDSTDSITLTGLSKNDLSSTNFLLNNEEDIDGTNGINVLSGGSGDDVINGLGGNDTIYGNDGDDTIDGGAGNDFISGGTGDNIIDGGDGNDSLVGGEGDDIISGGQGDDTISGGGGGADTFNGGDGDDRMSVSGESVNVTMTGGDGVDQFNLWRASGTLTITDFESGEQIDLNGRNWLQYDEVIARNFDELLDVTTQVGNDSHIALTNDFTIVLQNVSKTDLVEGDFRDYAPTLAPTEGDDLLKLTGENETIDGLGGDDRIIGGTGYTTIYGGAGNDDIAGGQAGSYIDGGIGDDWLKGSVGTDEIYGGDGNDSISGRSGNDTLYGNAGKDSILGNEGDDTLFGGDGDDALQGGSGTNTLDGGAGNDLIYSHSGTDTATGGSGNDTFKLGNLNHGLTVALTVTDFAAGAESDDKIDLTAFKFTTLADILAVTEDVNGDAVITVPTPDGDSTITLEGVSKAALHEDDFVGLQAPS